MLDSFLSVMVKDTWQVKIDLKSLFLAICYSIKIFAIKDFKKIQIQYKGKIYYIITHMLCLHAWRWCCHALWPWNHNFGWCTFCEDSPLPGDAGFISLFI